MKKEKQKLNDREKFYKYKYKMDIFNHPTVKMWLKDLALNNAESFVCLSKDNRESFKKIWGKYTWKEKEQQNITHVWSVYGNNLQWMIFTGTKGTCFYIITPVSPMEYEKDSQIGNGIIQFLSEILEFLIN